MPDQEIYQPSGELNNLLADQASLRAQPKPGLVPQPTPPDPTRTELEDGTPVVAYEPGKAYTKHDVVRFKRSQIAEMDTEDYNAARPAILKASLNHLIEDDISKKTDPKPTRQLSDMEKLYVLRNEVKDTKTKADVLYAAVEAAERTVEAEKYADQYDKDAAAARLADAKKAWGEANAEANTAKKAFDTFSIESRKIKSSNTV